MSVASIMPAGTASVAGFSEQQRRELLPEVARGEWLGAFAMSEPDAGSDIASIRTRADQGRRVGHQRPEDVVHVRRPGRRSSCVARTTPYDPARPARGHPPVHHSQGAGDVPAGLHRDPDPQDRLSRVEHLRAVLRRLFVPADCLLGCEQHRERRGPGLQAASPRACSTPRIHTAARSIGLARGALEDSINYVQEREQFGHPIGDFQATRFKIATMASRDRSCAAR